MTAAAISRIITQLGERTDAVVTCPFCEGGTRNRRTLSVNLRDGVWLYFCHRATCNAKGAVPALGDDGRLIVARPSFVPRPITLPLQLPEDTSPIFRRIQPLIDDSVLRFSLRHGLRTVYGHPGQHVWEIKSLRGVRRGHVSRTEDKFIKTWRTAPEPFYGYWEPRGTELGKNPLVIVEDPLSAALLAEDGLPAVALLSTNLSREAASEIAVVVDEYGMGVIVALDADAAGAGAAPLVLDRLRAAGVRKAGMWMLDCDVKNMDQNRRDSLSTALSAANFL